MRDRPKRISDLRLERLALGELSKGEAERAREELEAEEGGLQRLEELRRSDAWLLNNLPPADVAREVDRRARIAAVEEAERASGAGRGRWTSNATTLGGFLGPGSASGRRRWALIAPAMTAAVLAFMVLRLPSNFDSSDGLSGPADIDSGPALVSNGGDVENPVSNGGDVENPVSNGGDNGTDVTRAKGIRPHLRIYRQQEDSAERLKDSSEASEGDLLQLSYVAGGAAYGVVFSIDGAGTVTLHYPMEAGAEAKLESPGEQRLPFSYELDDAPDYERFFLVSSSQPFEARVVLLAARALARDPHAARSKALDLPDGFDQDSLLIQKATR